MLVPKSIADMHTICDTTTSRYALAGVLLERDGNGDPIAVATDGCMMLVQTWNEPDVDDYPETASGTATCNSFRAIIDASTIKQAKTAIKVTANEVRKRPVLDYMLVDESSTTKLSVANSSAEMTFSKHVTIDGRFPNWQHCISDRDESRVCVDAHKLEQILSAIRKHTTDSEGVCRVVLSISSHNEHLSITSEGGNGRKSHGIVMPLRNKDFTDDKPEAGWRTSPQRQEA